MPETDLLRSHTRLIIRKESRPHVARYVVHDVGPDGEPAAVVALAEKKRAELDGVFVLRADGSSPHELARLHGRERFDVSATAPDGTELGSLSREFRALMVRSRWKLRRSGAEDVTGREPHVPWALVRGALGAPAYRFDFAGDESGTPVLSIRRLAKLTDHLLVGFLTPEIDRRLGVCVAVAMNRAKYS